MSVSICRIRDVCRYLCVCVYMCACTYTCISWLCPLNRPRYLNTLVAVSTISTLYLVSKYKPYNEGPKTGEIVETHFS